MKKYLILLLIFTSLSCKKEINENQNLYLNSSKKEIKASFNGQEFPFEIINEDLYFPYSGKTNKIGFFSEIDSVYFDLNPKDSIPLTFVLNQKDSISVFVVGRTSPKSLYSEAHSTFEEDEVYNQKDAEGFIRLFSLSSRIGAMNKAEQAAEKK